MIIAVCKKDGCRVWTNEVQQQGGIKCTYLSAACRCWLLEPSKTKGQDPEPEPEPEPGFSRGAISMTASVVCGSL